jgi:hypothetical protein
MNIDSYIKINKKNTENALHKLATKNQKQNFHALINMHKIKIEKHYDVYAIAAKIARGESVSSDELKYIREHAPALLEDARKQFRESLEKEREKNIEIKHAKSVNETENNGESSTKTNKDSVEVVNNNQGSDIINKFIN